MAARKKPDPYTAHWRKMGRHFGYPKCCIEFFCAAWGHYWHRQTIIGRCGLDTVAIREHDAYFILAEAAGFGNRGKGPTQRIPCPKCLAKGLRRRDADEELKRAARRAAA